MNAKPALKFAGVALCVALVFGCVEKNGLPIRFVIPLGFRGEIKIVKSSDGKVMFPENGEYVFRIPTNGILYIDSLEPFHEWHIFEAQLSNGLPLPVRRSNELEQKSDELAFYNLGGSDKRMLFFVGSETEMLTYVRIAQPLETPAAKFLAGETSNVAKETR